MATAYPKDALVVLEVSMPSTVKSNLSASARIAGPLQNIGKTVVVDIAGDIHVQPTAEGLVRRFVAIGRGVEHRAGAS